MVLESPMFPASTIGGELGAPYVLVLWGHISKLLGGDIWSDGNLQKWPKVTNQAESRTFLPFRDAQKKSKPGANFSGGDIVLLEGVYICVCI